VDLSKYVAPDLVVAANATDTARRTRFAIGGAAIVVVLVAGWLVARARRRAV
jgi:hypothetical protein